MLNADYAEQFERLRRELGMEREDVLASVQTVLDAWYPGLVRAKRLHQGVLRLVTASASVAGELRLRQVELLAAARLEGVRVAISIGQLS
ncbi:MAG TPA: hypothetical protein VMT30_08700 [Candidatus Saccharimonadia bacterium]|nr:hypothetical protein [Candidatus Saccharimonadia bacterium]